MKAAISSLNQARADEERANLRRQQQDELNALRSGTGGASTGLAALNRAADAARVRADAATTIADIGQKPIDRQNAVEEARRIAAGGADPATESAVERLRRVAAAGK